MFKDYTADEFMTACEAGVKLGPTDKNYKVYVEAEGGMNAEGSGKFYFERLSEAQKDRFVQLLNEGTITVGYPGRFYVLPFFMALKQ